MKQNKRNFVCTKCGYKTNGYLGKCPSCGSFNSIEEIIDNPSVNKSNLVKSIELFHINSNSNLKRLKTGIDEFDRVMGGGIVSDSVTLVAGEPGIGKSTLLLQLCGKISDKMKVLYVSGEESASQLKMRSDRLKINDDNIYILNDNSIENIIEESNVINPGLIVIDSIQTMICGDLDSTSGSPTQVKEAAYRIINFAKYKSVAVFIIGHITKEGGIAGPKMLEHMVDVVIYFEGDSKKLYRLIRATKNRYGSTNEVGFFEMTDTGLSEVKNPSVHLLSDRPDNSFGNCAVCIVEGTRSIITEVQSLVIETKFPVPRRTSDGIDYNRLCLIIAILEKHLGNKFSISLFDIYINVIGGIILDDNSSDLAVAISLISSYKSIIIPNNLVAFGELGLSGECRSTSFSLIRVKESIRVGFKKIILPFNDYEKIKDKLPDNSCELIPVKNVIDLFIYLVK